MPTINEIMFGLVAIASGVVMVIYARKIVGWFGTSATFERYLGGGGTYTGLRIVGILFVIIGFLVTIGKMDDVILAIIASLGITS